MDFTPAFFDSLGFYVYGYREKHNKTYAYIGMGQKGRVISHLSEDKASEHPEFNTFLSSLEDPYAQVDIIASNLENKRVAEALEAYLIKINKPRLNRSPGNIRGAVLDQRALKDVHCEFMAAQWDSGVELLRLVNEIGAEKLFSGNHTHQRNQSNLKFLSPTIDGYSVMLEYSGDHKTVWLKCYEENLGQTMNTLEFVTGNGFLIEVKDTGQINSRDAKCVSAPILPDYEARLFDLLHAHPEGLNDSE